MSDGPRWKFLTMIAGLLEALEFDGASEPVFRKVRVTSLFDARVAMRTARFPMAFVYDIEGAPDSSTGTIEVREFGITVVGRVPRDGDGQATTRQLLNIGDLMKQHVQHGAQDQAVMWQNDSTAPPIPISDDDVALAHNYVFSYILDTTIEPEEPEGNGD